jgi:hypothetical protein
MTTTFTPENSALVLIDHQVGTMQLIKNIDVALARRMSLALAKTARIPASRLLTSSQEDRVQDRCCTSSALARAFEKRIAHRQRLTDANFKALSSDGAEESDHGRRIFHVCLVFPAIDAVTKATTCRRYGRFGSPYELSEECRAAGVTPASFRPAQHHDCRIAQNWGTPQGQQLIQLLFTEVLPPIQS